ncbi:MAG TPA: HAMP domain-containing sensor histidine kinase, partial [Enhygromyxa sp.]|nr:HAMP domain-containing sensor histidine kinase [Enhygromyxa sp.]
QLRQRTLVRVLSRLVRLRGLFLPLLLGFALWIGLSDAALWRRILMFTVAGVMTTLIAHDVFVTLRARVGRLPSAVVVVPNLVVVAIMQHILIFSTGGMASPIVPLVLLIVVLTGLVGDRRVAWTVVGCVHLPALWIETGVQLSGLVELTPTALAWPDGSSGQTPATTLVIAALMSFAILITTVFATSTAYGLELMVDEALRARDSALAARNQQARELTTLSGEIAHELKNPLASVKGLAQLIGRELERQEPPGKSAERMQVLRREVDRMQTILEEFLNFSRPLIPLNQRELELRELVDHVVDLHEGIAGERRVELRARGHARAVCDPRKVEQILINLVQNALEVAPPGTAIELEIVAGRRIADRPKEVRVHVRDQGPGLDQALRERLFEPGVTGKRDGSGLGLTIARALARQHGGELELVDRPDARGSSKTGCEATLTLPIPESQP